MTFAYAVFEKSASGGTKTVLVMNWCLISEMLQTFEANNDKPEPVLNKPDTF